MYESDMRPSRPMSPGSRQPLRICHWHYGLDPSPILPNPTSRGYFELLKPSNPNLLLQTND